MCVYVHVCVCARLKVYLYVTSKVCDCMCVTVYRQRLVDEYNTDAGIFVFLISTIAGGAPLLLLLLLLLLLWCVYVTIQCILSYCSLNWPVLVLVLVSIMSPQDWGST